MPATSLATWATTARARHRLQAGAGGLTDRGLGGLDVVELIGQCLHRLDLGDHDALRVLDDATRLGGVAADARDLAGHASHHVIGLGGHRGTLGCRARLRGRGRAARTQQGQHERCLHGAIRSSVSAGRVGSG
ncbi:MAG TPA: hypothetical protein PKC59_08510 [Burkholderiaceae bacterium]|nr:hypothetical protein [Burkholderiaceae bacterium]HMX09561.1 hypothetical protein [Burkholderiaceae bacterium]HNB43604.1 hypothetical protein [Burkholderiaceae bacterium]HNG79707.1 hypothetical protein [Burkholderiaceae bacterium]